MKLVTANVAMPKGKRDAVLFDSVLRGFGLRLRIGSGGKLLRTWIIQTRMEGRMRRMLIGSAELLTAAQARKQATKLLAQTKLGGNPAEEKRQRHVRDSHSLRNVIDDFLEHKSGVKQRTLAELRRYLQGPLYIKALHALPIDKVSRRDVSSRLLAIQKESGVQTAIALRAALSNLFSWALQMGLAENSPVIGAFSPAIPPARSRVLSDKELAMIWHGVEGDGDYAACIRLLICCACRRTEVGSLRWSEFSEDGTSFTIPIERSKGKRVLVVPITPLMQSVLDKIPHRSNTDFLFGTHGFTTWSLYKKMLDERLDLPPWVHHDLRRSVSTRMNDLNIAPPHVIEKILNHSIGGTHGIYNRSVYADEVRNAMLRWSTHLAEIIEGVMVL